MVLCPVFMFRHSSGSSFQLDAFLMLEWFTCQCYAVQQIKKNTPWKMVTYKEYSEKWEKQLMSKEKLTDIWKKWIMVKSTLNSNKKVTCTFWSKQIRSQETQTSRKRHPRPPPTPPRAMSLEKWIGVIDRTASCLLAQIRWVSTQFTLNWEQQRNRATIVILT